MQARFVRLPRGGQLSGTRWTHGHQKLKGIPQVQRSMHRLWGGRREVYNSSCPLPDVESTLQHSNEKKKT